MCTAAHIRGGCCRPTSLDCNEQSPCTQHSHSLPSPSAACLLQPMPVAELLVKRRQLIKRMQELEQVGDSCVGL